MMFIIIIVVLLTLNILIYKKNKSHFHKKENEIQIKEEKYQSLITEYKVLESQIHFEKNRLMIDQAEFDKREQTILSQEAEINKIQNELEQKIIKFNTKLLNLQQFSNELVKQQQSILQKEKSLVDWNQLLQEKEKQLKEMENKLKKIESEKANVNQATPQEAFKNWFRILILQPKITKEIALKILMLQNEDFKNKQKIISNFKTFIQVFAVDKITLIQRTIFDAKTELLKTN